MIWFCERLCSYLRTGLFILAEQARLLAAGCEQRTNTLPVAFSLDMGLTAPTRLLSGKRPQASGRAKRANRMIVLRERKQGE
jgi:hypothetical protein